VYKLSLTADDDIFIRTIRTGLRHWVIGPRLYFGDQVGYALGPRSGKVWTNAHHLSLSTFHTEGLQKISLGSAELDLVKSHTEYHLDRKTNERVGAQSLLAPKGDVRIIGDGYFAFTSEQLFLPAPRRFTEAADPGAEGVTAILTSYLAPRALGDGWYQGSINTPLSLHPGFLKLTLATPGIRERGGSVDVRAAHLRYSRPALGWRDWIFAVRQEVAGIWHEL
jgi:hypothetical protein